MVLLIDVGNTNIVFGISDGEKIVNTLRTETVKDADFDYVPVLQAYCLFSFLQILQWQPVFSLIQGFRFRL